VGNTLAVTYQFDKTVAHLKKLEAAAAMPDPDRGL
jgi:hypothetical protein